MVVRTRSGSHHHYHYVVYYIIILFVRTGGSETARGILLHWWWRRRLDSGTTRRIPTASLFWEGVDYRLVGIAWHGMADSSTATSFCTSNYEMKSQSSQSQVISW